MHRDQAGHAAALEIFAAHGVAGTLGRHHQHVEIGARFDQFEMDVEAMGEQQGRALLHVLFQFVLPDIGLEFVRRHHHHHIRPFGGVDDIHHLEARGLRLLGAGARTGRDHDILDAAVAHILRMGMTLGAEADDRDLLVLDQIEIGIPIIINPHFSILSVAPAFYPVAPGGAIPVDALSHVRSRSRCQATSRLMAATPVRDTSLRPSGRIASMKLEILTGASVSSNTVACPRSSRTRAPSFSAACFAAARPWPETFTSAISRSMPSVEKVQLVTAWTGTSRLSCASICSIT